MTWVRCRHQPRRQMGRMSRRAHLADPGGRCASTPPCARADGRHHQRGVPPAVRRAGRRALRLRDDHLPRPRRGRRDHAEDAGLRRARVGPLGAALRHRPGLRRQGRRDPLRRVRRRPHRPQLRLPGPQGDPQGRRGSAAVEARAARRDPRARGRRRRAVRRAGDDEDPQGHRRRPPDLPRRRPDRPGDRGAPRSRCTAGPWQQAYSGAADWDAIAAAGRPRRHPGARQRRHLGGRRRAADGRADRRGGRRRRPRLPGSAVAVPRPGRRVRRRDGRDPAEPRRGGGR